LILHLPIGRSVKILLKALCNETLIHEPQVLYPKVDVDDIVDPLLRKVNILNVRLHLPEELLLDYELGNIERKEGEKDEPGRGFEVLDAQGHEFLIYGFSQGEVGAHLTIHGGGHTADISLVIILQELASMVVIF
jgi:hypothetical protein